MRRVFRFKKRTWLLVGVVAVIAAMASVGAYAYFTSTGSGTGSATVGSATTWEVGQTGSTGASDLYPDPTIGLSGNIQTKSYHVQNNGSGNQSLGDVKISVANSDGSPWTLCKGVPAITDGANVSGGNCTNGSYVGKPACNKADFSIGEVAVGLTYADDDLAGTFTAGEDLPDDVTLQMIDNTLNQDNCQGAAVPLYFFAS